MAKIIPAMEMNVPSQKYLLSFCLKKMVVPNATHTGAKLAKAVLKPAEESRMD